MLVVAALLFETFCFTPQIEESALADASIVLEIEKAVSRVISYQLFFFDVHFVVDFSANNCVAEVNKYNKSYITL